jgi:hypothetical protein
MGLTHGDFIYFNFGGFKSFFAFFINDPSKENGQLKRKKKDKGCQRIA